MDKDMKKFIRVVATTVALLPCLLILNESDSFVPNLIGIAYLTCAVYITNN